MIEQAIPASEDAARGGTADFEEPSSLVALTADARALTVRKNGSVPPVIKKAKQTAGKDDPGLAALRERCLKLGLDLFLRGDRPIRSVGFTSAIDGEGKTLAALATAQVMARESGLAVTLIDCNWAHPTLHAHFDLDAAPGLAEWARGEAFLARVRHYISDNLSVIAAGDAAGEPARLVNALRQSQAIEALSDDGGIVIADLSSVTSSPYGALAAGLVDSVVLVARAGVTPEECIAEACADLGGQRVAGILLNQTPSHLPRWLRGLLE